MSRLTSAGDRNANTALREIMMEPNMMVIIDGKPFTIVAKSPDVCVCVLVLNILHSGPPKQVLTSVLLIKGHFSIENRR